MRTKSNRAHDPISKLLIQNRLVRIPVVLHNLEQSIDQRLTGWHLQQLASGWDAGDVGGEEGGDGDVEEDAEVLHILVAGFGLAVEERGYGDFELVPDLDTLRRSRSLDL